MTDQLDASPDRAAPADSDPKKIPEGAWAGLCMTCGAMKPWCRHPCDECGTESTETPDLDDVFSEQWLHRTSLEQLSVAFRMLDDAGVTKHLRDWTLYSYLRTSQPSVFTVRIPRGIRREVERVIRQYELPPINVRTSASVMPQDWDDHEAWDEYYAMWEPTGPEFPSEGLWALGDWFERLQREGRHRVWLPGCGLADEAWAFAAAGFDVLATDASAVAIDIQRSEPFRQSIRERFEKSYPTMRQPLEQPESLAIRFAVHDFRTPLGEDGFDCIINVQAFQALPNRSMQLAAQVHWTALAAGGLAVFSMLNVPRKMANRIERTLASVGFYVPLRGIEREEWRLLSSPRFPRWMKALPFGGHLENALQDGPLAPLARQQRDRRLRRLKQVREALQPEADRLKGDGHTKIAELLYPTG